MRCIVMPGGKDSEITYRVKCVAVESERVFDDVLVTQQTRNRIYCPNNYNYPDASRRRLSNLKKQILDTPDFMAMNRKRNNRQFKAGVAAIIEISNDTSPLEANEILIGNGNNYSTNSGNSDKTQKIHSYPLPMLRESLNQEVVVSSLVDQLLLDIYGCPRSERGRSESDSTASSYRLPPQHRYLQRARLLRKSKEELTVVLETLRTHVNHAGGLLVRQLRRRDYLVAKRDKHYDVITAHLQAYSAKRSEDTRMRFSLTPQPGESGFTQWLDAMKMVARLQGGIPQEFRKRLWLTLAERHLDQRGVDWKQAEKLCFNEWSNPDDEELGIQIVKDLHRTGCSLFCGAAGRDNQAVLRRVLLGFARWNKSVGYCQGLNVLAALVLQVTDRAESSAVKVMIYLIEGVLPEGYFADNLRGLSIDMAVFRDLLRMRLPKLSRHLEALQCDAKDKATGSSYEPPLTNVFTMQWFLTLFCHCLPQEAVLRVWDLIFLEGDEVLLRTALAIWEGISDRIMTVTSADEFYSIMGVLTREMLEFTDVNNLIKTIVNMGPLYGVTDLREKHRYNITPWARRMSDEEDTDTEDEERLAVAAAMFGVTQRFKRDRSTTSSTALQTIGPASERERIALDISTLKHQYAKLRERQRQAHIILSAACARQSMVPSTSQAMNHLLVGKSALVSAKTRQLGPPPGAIPPKPRTPALHSPRIQGRRDKQGVTLHWKDTKKPKETKDEQSVGDETETTATSVVSTTEGMSVTLTSSRRASSTTVDSDSDSTSTELCDEPDRLSDVDSEEPTSTSDCYIMATDDEKSPRPGTSPIAGNTPIRQNFEQSASGSLQVQGLPADSQPSEDHNCRGLLKVEEASTSIAMITDQIRRLSASEDINSTVKIHVEEKKEAKNETEEGKKVLARSDDFGGGIDATAEESFAKISPVRDKTEDDSATVQNFEKLDSYDYLSSGVVKSNANDEQLVDTAILDVFDNVGVVEKVFVGEKNSDSGDNLMKNSEAIEISAIGESSVGDLISRNSESGTTSNREITGLKLRDSVITDVSKHREDGAIVSSVNDQSDTNIGERTFYSRSYVIGHSPIAPTSFNEKLNKAAVEISTSNDNDKCLEKDIGTFDIDFRKDTSFTSVLGDEKFSKNSENSFSSFESVSTNDRVNPNARLSPMKDETGDSKNEIVDYETDVNRKIVTSSEPLSTSEQSSTISAFTPINEKLRSLSKDIESFELDVSRQINTSFDSVNVMEKKNKITDLSPLKDLEIFSKDTSRFNNGLRKTDTTFDNIQSVDTEIKPTDLFSFADIDLSKKESGNLAYAQHKTTELDSSSGGKSIATKINDLSPLKETVGISTKDSDLKTEVRKNDKAPLDAIKAISPSSKILDTSPSLTLTDSSIHKYGTNTYELHKSVGSTTTSSIAKSKDAEFSNASSLSESIKKTTNDLVSQSYSDGKKLLTNSGSEARIPGNTSVLSESRNLIEKVSSIDYSASSKIDSNSTRLSVSSFTEKKSTLEDRRIDPNLSLIGIGTSRLSSDYVYQDSSSTKIHDAQKRSPKSPESTNSFSSGETMGPDSKTSSLTTSPRTPNLSDSRHFAIDKSARSSVSSDSKTLTLCSMDSDVGGARTKLNSKLDTAKPSLDKSSPSTPISTDSLKNKSEISPKFIISSSSESCSPGKAKSSDRSFSSELQSPISANSIKYRTNYAEGQDNLSESPMDIGSATSPFYPIVYPNQKTPSPYGTTGKLRKNTDSTETSPEQKSTSSKEETPSGKFLETVALKTSKTSEVARSSKDRNDDYDSARPFEKELAETLSALPSESISRTKNERISSVNKDTIELGDYRKKNAVDAYLDEDISARFMETDTVSPLPGDKYEKRSAFVDKSGSFKAYGINERDHKYLLSTRESFKPFERSCSSLDKRFGELKSSPSSEEFGANAHKKRSSDILEDLRHLEAKSTKDGKTDTSMLTRKTGYDWEDLKNLEARRQDNFSDSASEFSRGRLDVPSINVFGETRKSYVVEPKINLEDCSILKNYVRKERNGEANDDRESKLGVWTKVKPRASRDNGRRSSDRALKIIQENSAILHKILTCQAKKRLPDLEEISKEITISPINEEISKIFSPILEKMGLNEHEINEELARINFKDFDQMTATSGSEFDAKMNDELSKLSLIDDNEIVDHLDVDDVISRDYLDTREALIDRQINEELSKLLANYEEASPICIANRDEASSCQNPSELEGLELSSISNNVFSYQSSNDSIETKSELGPIQDPAMQVEKFSQYTENISSFAQPPKYSLRSLSPRSDIDIYRELEKLDKISSGEILPSSSSSVTQKIISPISYAPDLPSYSEIRPSSLEYRAKPEPSFDPSPMKSSPYDTYKPYDFKSRISPRKTPSNPYSARSYEKSAADFEFQENSVSPSRLYDLGTSRPILSKETLEFRVRYDDESSKQIRDVDLTLEPYHNDLPDLERGASYYTDETPISLKRLATETDRTLNPSVVSPLDYTYNPTDLYSKKYDQISSSNYPYAASTMSYEKQSYGLEDNSEGGSYLSMRRKNSHSLSPNYQYADREFASSINPYTTGLSPSHEDPSKRPVSHPEFADTMTVANYTEVPSRDSISFRKASLSLGPLDGTASRNPSGIDGTPSPRSSLFSPFPVRNAPRKRKELGLKLGLYSPSSPGSAPLKRS